MQLSSEWWAACALVGERSLTIGLCNGCEGIQERDLGLVGATRAVRGSVRCRLRCNNVVLTTLHVWFPRDEDAQDTGTRIHTLKLLCNCLDCGSLGLRLIQTVQARCDQMAVAIHVVDASGCRPELGLAHPGRGEGGRLAGVWPVPLVRQHDACRVRRMLRARRASAGTTHFMRSMRQRRTLSTLLSLFAAPVSICLISWRMAIIASQKRSSSACTRFASVCV